MHWIAEVPVQNCVTVADCLDKLKKKALALLDDLSTREPLEAKPCFFFFSRRALALDLATLLKTQEEMMRFLCMG